MAIVSLAEWRHDPTLVNSIKLFLLSQVKWIQCSIFSTNVHFLQKTSTTDLKYATSVAWRVVSRHAVYTMNFEVNVGAIFWLSVNPQVRLSAKIKSQTATPCSLRDVASRMKQTCFTQKMCRRAKCPDVKARNWNLWMTLEAVISRLWITQST